jgi:hypothetical protein
MNLKKRLKTTVSAGTVALGLALAASPASASTNIGTVYEHKGMAGAALAFTAGSNGYVCTTSNAEVEGGTRKLANFGFDEKISSFVGFSNCQIKLYEGEYMTGSSFGFSSRSWYIGDAMNDEASSVWIS